MNCKPGDLAVFVNPRITENAGRFVTVIHAIGWLKRDEWFHKQDRSFVANRDDFYWWVEATTPLKSHLLLGKAIYRSSGIAPDSALRPIRPDGLTTEEVKELYSPLPPVPSTHKETA